MTVNGIDIPKAIPVASVIVLVGSLLAGTYWLAALSSKVDMVIHTQEINSNRMRDIDTNSTWIRDNKEMIRSLPRLEQRMLQVEQELLEMKTILMSIDNRLSTIATSLAKGDL